MIETILQIGAFVLVALLTRKLLTMTSEAEIEKSIERAVLEIQEEEKDQ